MCVRVPPLQTVLLQIADHSSACYLLAEDVRKVLNLNGHYSHLFDLLCAHAQHEHADRHLATHCAVVHRKIEGYCLVDAHPAFADPIALTGMINEPCATAILTVSI